VLLTGICKSFFPSVKPHSLRARPFLIEAASMVAGAILIFATLTSKPNSILVGADNVTHSTSTSQLKHKPDILGCLTLISAVTFPLLAMNIGGNILPWFHPLEITLFLLTPVTVVAFCYVESRLASCPVIPLRFLKSCAVLKVLLASVPIMFAWNQVCH